VRLVDELGEQGVRREQHRQAARRRRPGEDQVLAQVPQGIQLPVEQHDVAARLGFGQPSGNG
jgi:hypothetical protein